MKNRLINDRYDLIVPDNVADWDAPSAWERERIDHTFVHIRPEDVLLDVGVEHGWITGLYAKYADCGMILLEPSPEFWPNIYGVWGENHLRQPLSCWPAFAAAEPQGAVENPLLWPDLVQGPECGAMAYRYLHAEHHIAQSIPVVTIDQIAALTPFTAITMDIEGAEYGALLGARSALENLRPQVWVSIHPDLMKRDYGSTPQDILDLMEGLGYSATHLATDHEEHWYFSPRGAGR